jgi:hypothetical protein
MTPSKKKIVKFVLSLLILEIKCQSLKQVVKGGVMVLNATFNNISVISWRSVLLVEEQLS